MANIYYQTICFRTSYLCSTFLTEQLMGKILFDRVIYKWCFDQNKELMADIYDQTLCEL